MGPYGFMLNSLTSGSLRVSCRVGVLATHGLMMFANRARGRGHNCCMGFPTIYFWRFFFQIQIFIFLSFFHEVFWISLCFFFLLFLFLSFSPFFLFFPFSFLFFFFFFFELVAASRVAASVTCFIQHGDASPR